MPKPSMMFYTDPRVSPIGVDGPRAQRGELWPVVGELAGTPVDALMYCLEGGTATLREVCDQAHAKGMLVYPTLLVQHGRDARGGPRHGASTSETRWESSALDIGAGGDLDPGYPGSRCADFKHAEVRDERLAVIEEVVTGYPVDGLELQLNYWPYYFHPDEAEDGRSTMTEWIGRVHGMVKKSGLDRELAITVPASLDDCLAAGLDPPEWIRQGIVDVLIGQPTSRPKVLDPDATFIRYDASLLAGLRALVDAARGSDCRVHASIDTALDSDRLSQAPIEMVRAAACNYWAQGIDGLYLRHWTGTYDGSFYDKLRELPHPDVMAPRDKLYHVPTSGGVFGGADATESGSAPTPGLNNQLPAVLEVGRPARVELTISDDLTRWDSLARVHSVLLRARVMMTTELDKLSFKLNGQDLPSTLMRKVNQMYHQRVAYYRILGYWFIFSLDREHWPEDGSNILEVTLVGRDPDMVEGSCILRDIELEVKYLMGKGANRGYVDADLGPTEHAGS